MGKPKPRVSITKPKDKVRRHLHFRTAKENKQFEKHQRELATLYQRQVSISGPVSSEFIISRASPATIFGDFTEEEESAAAADGLYPDEDEPDEISKSDPSLDVSFLKAAEGKQGKKEFQVYSPHQRLPTASVESVDEKPWPTL